MSATSKVDRSGVDKVSNHEETKEVDIFRDTWIRYLGYANEIGESFRAQIPVNAVRFTYAVAIGYVCADAQNKGKIASQHDWPDEPTRQKKTFHAVGDTLVWQGLASVIIPGFTINRVCWATNLMLHKGSKLPGPARKWTTTAVGLAVIPLIIKPIDASVDWLMETTLRKWYCIHPTEQKIVYHDR